MNVLLIGSGGREHALAWKMAQSNLLNKLYIAPGNGGTSDFGVNVDIDINDFEMLKDFSLQENIQLIVVGPEVPLVKGISNYFNQHFEVSHIDIIGPSKEGAMLEGSKQLAKEFMSKYNIPTASFKTFSVDTIQEGIDFITHTNPPYVIKADGLAGGKGVIISLEKNDAIKHFSDIFTDNTFGDAGDKVLIEQFLTGIELSVIIATDGKSYIILPEAKDYKRIGVGDTGPNTGGMGAVSPVPFADKAFMAKAEELIIKPTMRGIIEERLDYKGFLFIGIMNCDGDPYVIEYNCRLGDPETQVIIPRIESDIIELFERIISGSIDEYVLNVNPDFAATVVLVSEGYPNEYETHLPIIDSQTTQNSLVFHAGTTKDVNDNLITNGGRVMSVTSMGEYLKQALDVSYYTIDHISFKNMYYRKDIGQDLLNKKTDSIKL